MKIKVTSTDGTTLKTANKYCEEDIHIILDESIKNSGNGANLNIAYGETPPADTSKLWLNCQEPSGVEIQNYLEKCAVDEVLEYGTIANPTTYNGFKKGYSNPCYIGNNQIAIVGYSHIRIYDLTTKSYIADYTISGIPFEYCTNVILKDNVLYFGYMKKLYSYDLSTQTLTTLYTFSNDAISYILFYNETEINLYTYYSGSSYVHRYNLTTKTVTQITRISNKTNFMNMYSSSYVVKVGNTLYCFSTSGWKYVDNADNFTSFTSFTNFIKNTFNSTTFAGSSAIYDNERYIYLVGGGGSTTYDNLIKYDTVNDTFELLDTKLLSGKCNALSVLVDNRVYMFGGDENTTYGYGRKNYIDYFDLKYPLNENNAIVTTNAINTDVMVNLINEDTIKLKSNVASAYIGNADNLAEKVNAYYYKITGEKPSGYSGLIFDKNTILKNYSTLIEMAESSNMDMLSFPFKNSEGIVYTLGVGYHSSNNSLDIIIIDEDINLLFSVSINSNGDFNSTSTYGDSIWVEGDTYTFKFGEYFEFTNEVNGEIVTTATMDDFALMGTAIGGDGGVLGKWLGINTKDPFEWTNEDVTLALGDVLEWDLTYNNNLGWEMTYEVSSDLEVSNTNDNIKVNAGTTKGTYVVNTFASTDNSTYEGTFNVEVVDAITWTTIPDQTIAVGSSTTIDLSNYYTNVSYNEPTFSIGIAGGGYNVSWNSYLLTIQNEAGSGTIAVTVKATVNGIEYSTPFNLISTDTTE